VRRDREEGFDRDLPGLQAIVQALVGKVEMPFGGADGVGGVVGGHAMVSLVPAYGFGAGVDGQHGSGR
jgi:hypothetical protein